MKILIIDTKNLNVPDDEAERLIAKYEEPPKSPARLIREQLEREGMTVKQILAKNLAAGGACNRLTPIEARRREVERAAELVREKLLDNCDKEIVVACYNASGELCAERIAKPDVGGFHMQSTAQWHLLRDVIGDEGLRELIQK